MINVTKEQIKEVLERLKDYSYWVYYSDKCHEILTKEKIKFENHEFYLDVRKDGLIEMILENGIKCVYEPIVMTRPILKDSLDNLNPKVRFVNKEKLTEEYIRYFEKVGIFVCSYFQRAISFIFFYRMHQETMDRIVFDLEQLNMAKQEL